MVVGIVRVKYRIRAIGRLRGYWSQGREARFYRTISGWFPPSLSLMNRRCSRSYFSDPQAIGNRNRWVQRIALMKSPEQMLGVQSIPQSDVLQGHDGATCLIDSRTPRPRT